MRSSHPSPFILGMEFTGLLDKLNVELMAILVGTVSAFWAQFVTFSFAEVGSIVTLLIYVLTDLATAGLYIESHPKLQRVLPTSAHTRCDVELEQGAVW
mmetsp:Transcript_51918/g.144889  ORF Transcript_51918/g.144889 Transcript_51918/m.144889 type:complete len:99 (-) Transcript_51918:66-362(-)